ncbi:dentin sialophosphoprotein-like isoform X2 [Paramacrobiotus metropolitanus]|uniref:dentin sialophosphoprotein-like isoform X2 n=1 Tax=Paramacrobiotus metropolitanus TaxID=2943436 RepID=UPI0024461582|nr:dentin sialophosphoprotein-like isoform X2 [Paramacrobiotus metropolitanus]
MSSESEELCVYKPEEPNKLVTDSGKPVKNFKCSSVRKIVRPAEVGAVSGEANSKKRKLHESSPEIEPNVSPSKEDVKRKKIPTIGDDSDESDSDTEINKQRHQAMLRRLKENARSKKRDVESSDSEDEVSSKKQKKAAAVKVAPKIASKSSPAKAEINMTTKSSDANGVKEPSPAKNDKSSSKELHRSASNVEEGSISHKNGENASTDDNSENEQIQNSQKKHSKSESAKAAPKLVSQKQVKSDSMERNKGNRKNNGKVENSARPKPEDSSDVSDNPKKLSKIESSIESRKHSKTSTQRNTEKSSGSDKSDSDIAEEVDKFMKGKSNGAKSNSVKTMAEESSEESVSEASEKNDKRAKPGKETNTKAESKKSNDSGNAARSKSSTETGASTKADDSDSGSHEKTKKDSKNASAKEKDDPLKRYKTYLKEAGIRINNYGKFFAGINSVKKQKERILEYLAEQGLQGKPTVESCRKLRAKRETAAEIASLDTKNIVSGRTRGSRSAAPEPVSHGAHSGKKPAGRRLKQTSVSDESDSDDLNVGALAHRSDDEEEDGDAFAGLRDCIGDDSE